MITDGLIDGEVRPTAYICDVRVARDADKETKQEWRKFYMETVTNSHNIQEFENCEYMYSAILDANKIALKAFVKEDSPLKFYPTQNYQAVQVLGRKWLSGSRSKFAARKVRSEERSKIIQFLRASNAEKSLGTSEAELLRREKNWPDYDLNSFLVCENENGQWMSICAPTSFTQSRSLVVEKATKSVLWLSKLAILFGGPSVKENEDLKTTYFTHLEFMSDLSEDDRIWCLRAFLDATFTDVVTENGNLISFAWPVGKKVARHPALSRYLTQTTYGTYYQVYPKARENNLTRFKNLKDISFEMALA